MNKDNLDSKTTIYILETENEMLKAKVKKLENDVEEYLDLHNILKYDSCVKLTKEM